MTTWNTQANELFLKAKEFPNQEERQKYLDSVCGSDNALRAEVVALLDASEKAGSFLEAPALGLPETINMYQEKPGQVIGQFKLLEKLGEGGMGTVWMAQQSEPVKRLVALKLIKPGMDSVSVLRRFDAERQALALMSHNNIAKMFGAEKTESGRPYFVMELVKGVPITKYCDETHASIEERLRLFIPVCQAVQHAHQKGIIHRDIKPSNVLVCIEDGKPVPKVIDFGVAKALHQPLTDGTLHTGFNQIVGTLEYMSPEQAELNALDIDTRADVYALGVLLFELLTGSTPVTRDELRQVALVGMLRQLKEAEPRKPSTRLSESKQTIASLAAMRRTDPAKLMREVRGDLDWIVLKCLEADRTRRYETTNALVRDVERHLANEPVEARAPSAVYRLKKFVWRNRWAMAAASVIFLCLVGGVIGTSWGMYQANVQREMAEKSAIAERDAKVEADKKRAEAETNLAFAKKGNELLGSVFEGLNPKKIAESGRPLQDILKDNLKKAVKELEGSVIGDPLTVAEMQLRLGGSLIALGEYEQAIEVLRKSRNINLILHGVEHKNTLTSTSELARAYLEAGKLDLALPLFKEIFTLEKNKLGAEHLDTLYSMLNLGVVYQEAGKLDLALPLFEECLKLSKDKLGINHPLTMACMTRLAYFYQRDDKLGLAIPLLEEVFKLRKNQLGTEHPETIETMHNLGATYRLAGKLDLALPLLEESLKLMKNKLGYDYPLTLTCMDNLASTYKDSGKIDQALPIFEETLKLSKDKRGADHPNTLVSMNNLANAYLDAGRLDLALSLFNEAFKLSKSKLGADHPLALATLQNIGATYWKTGNLDLSIPVFEELLQLHSNKRGRNCLDAIDTMGNLGMNYLSVGRTKDALTILEEAWELAQKHRPFFKRLSSLPGQVAAVYLRTGQFAKAEPLLRENLDLVVKTGNGKTWSMFTAKSTLGQTLQGLKKYEEAEPLLTQGYEGLKQHKDELPEPRIRVIPETLQSLIELYEATNKPEEAAKWRTELEKTKAELAKEKAKPQPEPSAPKK